MIALYAPLQFFVLDKKDVINCTALPNNQLRISGTKNYAQLGLFYKKTYYFEATDRSTTARGLKAVALILDSMLSLRLCLRLTILADSLGTDLARQNV